MIPPYPVSLMLVDHRGHEYAILGTVTADHGPQFEYRYLVTCPDYDDFGSHVEAAPGCRYVTWASEAMIVRAEQEAA